MNEVRIRALTENLCLTAVDPVLRTTNRGFLESIRPAARQPLHRAGADAESPLDAPPSKDFPRISEKLHVIFFRRPP